MRTRHGIARPHCFLYLLALIGFLSGCTWGGWYVAARACEESRPECCPALTELHDACAHPSMTDSAR